MGGISPHPRFPRSLPLLPYTTASSDVASARAMEQYAGVGHLPPTCSTTGSLLPGSSGLFSGEKTPYNVVCSDRQIGVGRDRQSGDRTSRVFFSGFPEAADLPMYLSRFSAAPFPSPPMADLPAYLPQFSASPMSSPLSPQPTSLNGYVVNWFRGTETQREWTVSPVSSPSVSGRTSESDATSWNVTGN